MITAVREAATICPCPLQVDLSALKVVSESGSVKELNIWIYFFFFRPSLNGVLFLMLFTGGSEVSDCQCFEILLVKY